MSLFDQKMADLQELLHKKEISVTDLVKESYNRIKDVDEKVQAFLTLDEDNALSQASALDDKLVNGEHSGSLFGMPIGIKDNIVTKNLRTTCSSKILENFQPIYNATVMDKLQAAGAITIGKLNMDEFAMGSSTENSYYQKTKNPWNLETVPGGSSGGSAASVAAGEVFFLLVQILVVPFVNQQHSVGLSV